MPGLDFLYGGLGAADAITNLVAQRNFQQQQAALQAQKSAQQDFENRAKAFQLESEDRLRRAQAAKEGQTPPDEFGDTTVMMPDGTTQVITYSKRSGTKGSTLGGGITKEPAAKPELPEYFDPQGKSLGYGSVDTGTGGVLIGGHVYGPGEATKVKPPTPESPDVVLNRRLTNQKLQNELDQAQAGGALGTDPGAMQGLHGDAYLQTLNPAQAAKIKALAEGRLAFPTSRSMAQPLIQQLINQVAQYDPTFDAVNFQSRQKTRENFTSGPQSQQVNALNTAIGHLNELSSAVDALHNTSLTPVNTVKNYLSRAGGSSATTNFQANVGPVADELEKVWRNNGGSEQGIQDFRKALDASGSPEQLYGAIAKFGHLLESKIQSLQDQYQQGMGTSDIHMLRPDSEKILNALEQKAKGGGVPAAGPKEGDQQPIPSIPGGVAEYRNGRWIRIK